MRRSSRDKVSVSTDMVGARKRPSSDPDMYALSKHISILSPAKLTLRRPRTTKKSKKGRTVRGIVSNWKDTQRRFEDQINRIHDQEKITQDDPSIRAPSRASTAMSEGGTYPPSSIAGGETSEDTELTQVNDYSGIVPHHEDGQVERVALEDRSISHSKAKVARWSKTYRSARQRAQVDDAQQLAANDKDHREVHSDLCYEHNLISDIQIGLIVKIKTAIDVDRRHKNG